nr:trithorax group protein osa-like [Lytechinus pictus]
MTAMYYNSSTNQQHHHQHQHAPQPLHPHQPHHHQTPGTPQIVPGMHPEPGAMSGFKPPPPVPPPQLQGGVSGMYQTSSGGAVATMNGKKVPLTELPRYITTCYPFVQDSSTGAAPASESWMGYPSQQSQQVQHPPPQSAPVSLPPNSQHPLGHHPQATPQTTPMYTPPPGHQTPTAHLTQQQNQEYFPVHPGYNQVPHQTPSQPVSTGGPLYQQGGYQQHGNNYQPHLTGNHPAHHNPAQSPVPMPLASQPSMPTGIFKEKSPEDLNDSLDKVPPSQPVSTGGPLYQQGGYQQHGNKLPTTHLQAIILPIPAQSPVPMPLASQPSMPYR